MIKRSRRRENVPETIQERTLRKEWEQLDQDVKANLIRSMPRRLNAVIET